MKFKERSTQKKDLFSLVLDYQDLQISALNVNSISKVLPQLSLHKQLLVILEIINVYFSMSMP